MFAAGRGEGSYGGLKMSNESSVPVAPGLNVRFNLGGTVDDVTFEALIEGLTHRKFALSKIAPPVLEGHFETNAYTVDGLQAWLRNFLKNTTATVTIL